MASLHTDILKNVELNNFYKIYPEKFNNKTNGITLEDGLFIAIHSLQSLLHHLLGMDLRKMQQN